MARTTQSRPATRRGPSKHAELILATLRDLARPASAYDIQSQLAGIEHLAPQTIYRALERLMEAGSVHKIESLNAFVACCHKCHKEPSVFAICDSCGTVAELTEPGITKVIGHWSRQADFSVTEASLELHGACGKCRSQAEVSA